MLISMIYAKDPNGLVGKGNSLPWHSKEDLAWFVKNTKGKTILMGRTTLEGIGKVLPNRVNLVLSRDPEYVFPGAITVTSIEEAIIKADAHNAEELVICGGPQVYDLALPYVKRIYLTEMRRAYEGDVYYKPNFIVVGGLAIEQAYKKMTLITFDYKGYRLHEDAEFPHFTSTLVDVGEDGIYHYLDRLDIPKPDHMVDNNTYLAYPKDFREVISKDAPVDLEISLLRTLMAIADGGTFGKGADKVGLTQSAVSQQMQRLGDLVGTPLFKVVGRNRVLTSMGEFLLSHARMVVGINDNTMRTVLKDFGGDK